MTSELAVFFSAMTPVLDLKLAIPLGLKFGLSKTTIFLFSVAGGMVPAALTLWLLEPVSSSLRKRSKKIDIFFTKLFEKTRKEHSKNFNRYGSIFLLLFIVLPLPGSGSTGGAIVSFVFGLDPWKALSLIALGISIGALLILAGFSSIFATLNFFAS